MKGDVVMYRVASKNMQRVGVRCFTNIKSSTRPGELTANKRGPKKSFKTEFNALGFPKKPSLYFTMSDMREIARREK